MALCFGDFELDVEALELRRNGELLQADAMVLRLLACLANNAGQLVSKDELVEQVWGGRAIADNAITVAVARLRKLLGQTRDGGAYVLTTYGRGYRFLPPVRLRHVARKPLVEQTGGVTGMPPFVGRSSALEQLRNALQQASSGHGRCCVLVGEPGSGKTHTIERFEQELNGSPVRVAWGFCREAGDTPPLWPWLRLLQRVVPLYGWERLQAELGDAAPDLSALLQLSASAADSGSAQKPSHFVYQTLVRALRLISEQQPWVLVVDDLHRADAASLELLHAVLDELGQMRLLVVCTLRRTLGRRPERTGTFLPRVLVHRHTERIALTGLTRAEVQAYVTSLVRDPDGHLSNAIFDKSEGNPFFMAELVRVVRDGEPTKPDLGGVPPASLELIRQRMIRLDDEVRTTLSAAAVIGRSFELPLLSKLTGRDPISLMSSLDAALEDEVVVASAETSTGFAFAHALLWTVLYDALAPKERRRLHAKVAALFEERSNNGELVAPSELAFHYHAALPDCDLRRTIDACRKAAEASAAVFAGSDVVRYIRHALEALDLLGTPSGRLRLSLWYAIAVFAREHPFPGGGYAVQGVVRLARQQRDGSMMLRAATIFNLHPGLSPIPGASAALEEALGMLTPDDVGLSAVGKAALACAAPQCFSAETSRSLINDAVGIARASNRSSLYTVLIYKLYYDGGPGAEAEGEQTARELEQFGVDHPRVAAVMSVDVALHRAVSAVRSGDSSLAGAVMQRAIRRCYEVNHGQLRWHSERFALLLQMNQIGPEEVATSEPLAALTQLHQHREQFGAETLIAFDRAVTLAELGQSFALDEALQQALRAESSDPPTIWALKVRALASSGQHGQARALLGTVSPARLAELPCDRDYLGTLGHITAAVIELQANAYYDQLYKLLTPHASRYAIGISGLNEGSVEQLLGQLAALRGESARAVKHLEAGVRANRAAGLALRTEIAQRELARATHAQ